MLLTTGDVIDAAGRYFVHAGSELVYTDENYRHKSLFFLDGINEVAHHKAPHYWKLMDGTVTVTSGTGTLPTTFGSMGQLGQVYVSGRTTGPLRYVLPDELIHRQVTNPSSGGDPEVYTIRGRSASGVPQILTYPASSSTLLIKNYSRKMPAFIDKPIPPTLGAGSATGLTGTYRAKVTFVTADGETEGSYFSDVYTPANNKINWTGVALSPRLEVTSRKLYRIATGGYQYKLVTTLSDNITPVYSNDNLADVSLGANIPTQATAVTGMEQYPEDFVRSIFFKGLVSMLMRAQGDMRDMKVGEEVEKAIVRMWAEHKPGQNQPRVMPAYGGANSGSIWDRFTPSYD